MSKSSASAPRRSKLDNPPNAVCTFCGRGRRDTGIMVEGPGPDLYICRQCADLVQNLFEQIAKEANASGEIRKQST